MAETYRHKVPSDVAVRMSLESAPGLDSRRDSYRPKAENKVCHSISKPRKMKKFPILTLTEKNAATERT